MKPARLISMLFLVALALTSLSCGMDQSAMGPSAANPEFSTTKLKIKLVKCSIQVPVTGSLTIGPRGGSITVGKNKLEVPAGALSRDVLITMRMFADSTNSVQLFPEGLKFNVGKPARLTLDYSNCSLLATVLPAKIVYTDNLLNILQILTSLDDKLKKKVTAPLEHFSRYAVAW